MPLLRAEEALRAVLRVEPRLTEGRGARGPLSARQVLRAAQRLDILEWWRGSPRVYERDVPKLARALLGSDDGDR